MPLLAGSREVIDAWLSDGPMTEGRSGLLHWRHNAEWLYGALAFDAPVGELAACVEQAYLDLFDALRSTGFVHPLRLWNYVPRINADEGGLERYRHFNLGRQQAFLKAGQAAFEGSPAACALGPQYGPIVIRVLAGRRPSRPIENPRQVSAYHYPNQYGPRAPTFSRAALADAGGGQVVLSISGTASIVGHQSVHVGDLAGQVRETLANLEAVIGTAHRHTSARFALRDLLFTVYVRHAADGPAVRTMLEQALGADAPAVREAVLLQADICRHDLLVEIEAQAHAPGEVCA
ncbi:hypothetical protein HLB44_16970 [Aquincola sp. S2]|uniref:Chorismatase FkbO/Hyg5-like N-terminal domain-containing protein n=1 Tax=Pseudaquabacterium terrae TaxID=2732868 RepID=A0ABX2EJD4_9BURK|nr:hypothetical protein [Aquabacterium terrae]